MRPCAAEPKPPSVWRTSGASVSTVIAVLAGLASSCMLDFDAPFAGAGGELPDASIDTTPGGAGGAADASEEGIGIDATGGTQGDTGTTGGSAGAGGSQPTGGAGGSQPTGGAGGSAGTAGEAGQGGDGGTAGTADSGGGGCTPVGHDEDSDQLDDACDNCPSISNAGQANADLDGIGDVCETLSSPTLLSLAAYFEPFLATALPDWTLGDFEVGGDEAVVDALCNPSCGRNAVWDTSLKGAHAVEVQFHFESPADRYGCVLFALEPTSGSDPKWWTCCVERVSVSESTLGLWYSDGVSGSITMQKQKSAVESAIASPSVSRRLRVDYVPGAPIVCTLDNAVGDHETLQHTPSYWAAESKAGLRAYDANARFSSFVVYQ